MQHVHQVDAPEQIKELTRMEYVCAKLFAQVSVNKGIEHSFIQRSLSSNNEDDWVTGASEEFRLSIISLLEGILVGGVQVVDPLRKGMGGVGWASLDLAKNLNVVY